MKIQCDYCGNTYEDYQPQCPKCGAPNPSHHDNDKQPRTISALQQWYEDRHLPPYETTRFFIGINYTKPKAFGIYKDENTGDFVVYKNKADGTRAIRYQGKDEAYAVNELYQKLKDEIVHQKNRSQQTRSMQSGSTFRRRSGGVRLGKFGWFVIIAWFIIIFTASTVTNKINKYNGYYDYNDTVYYKDGGTWYYFDDSYDDWYTTYEPAQYSDDNHGDYYLGTDYDNAQMWDYENRFTDIQDNYTYQSAHESHDSDYDSDYDWGGSDSWDSGGTDWGSDW